MPASADAGDAVEAAGDPVDCLRALVVTFTFCYIDGSGCTSTSRCTGADAGFPGKKRACVDVFCTPWLPYCAYLTVWYTDEEDSPTLETGVVCPPIVIGVHTD